MSSLTVICFLAFISFGLVGLVTAFRRKKTAKRHFLFSILSLALMIVFASLIGNSESGDAEKNAASANKNAYNNEKNEQKVNQEQNGNSPSGVNRKAEVEAKTAEDAKALEEKKAKAEAEAKEKAEAQAKQEAESKAKQEAAAKQNAQAKAKQKAALAQMVREADEVEGVTWYKDKAAPKYINTNGIYAYFGVMNDNTVTKLHLKIQYAGDNWIFIRKYVFNIDGVKYEINPGFLGAERDMSTNINSPGVWEYHDETLNSHGLELLKAMIDSQKTIMRLSGDQRNKDVTISVNQKAALKRVLDAYIAAGGRL